GVEGKLGRHRTLIERRQETAREKPSCDSGCKRGKGHGCNQRRAVGERPVEQDLYAALERAKQTALVIGAAPVAGEQEIRKDRRDGDGYEQRREDRDDVGDTERGEQAPLDVGKREQ